MRVLVCGGRGFGEVPKGMTPLTPEHNRCRRRAGEERALLAKVLGSLEPRPTLIIHGAASGADRLAAKWAKGANITDQPFKADWYPNGFGRLDRSAGPRRNQKMLDNGKPDLVIAFPGGNGTADMVKRATAAGVEVRRITIDVGSSREGS
jgi:hypothetical protein